MIRQHFVVELCLELLYLYKNDSCGSETKDFWIWPCSSNRIGRYMKTPVASNSSSVRPSIHPLLSSLPLPSSTHFSLMLWASRRPCRPRHGIIETCRHCEWTYIVGNAIPMASGGYKGTEWEEEGFKHNYFKIWFLNPSAPDLCVVIRKHRGRIKEFVGSIMGKLIN